MIAIPSSATDRFETDELALSLTGDQVGEVKPLPGHRWGG
jgi:hypothetical protein